MKVYLLIISILLVLQSASAQDEGCPCSYREADPLFPGAEGHRWDCEYVEHGLLTIPKECWLIHPDVTQVFLDYNEIEHLDQDSFSELFNLQVLSLRENKIKTIDHGVLTGLTGLKYLDLANNKLADLPMDLWQLTDLTHLDISNNQLIDALHYKIMDLYNLEFLDLHLNHLTYILPDSLRTLRNLRRFHIYWNMLTTLPVLSDNLLLDEVLVHGNAIMDFPKYVFGTLTKPLTYHFVDNPAYDIWGTMLLALPDRSHIKMGNDVSVWAEDEAQAQEILARDWLVQDGLLNTIDLATLVRICGQDGSLKANGMNPPC